ncbi:MAG: hypothetical protein P8Y44_02830 [Acidobacteriota bacterium]
MLLSMRDDFLFHCTGQEALAPIYSELTPLKPLSGTALRRALVQPALKCGYRFEDDTLVDEMVAEVADERGALPLLAFAAARLWSLRDREQGLLTREAYEHIGGVGGALAQHAEQTLERIGHDQILTVREIFRNLVTAQGTRLARGRDELLSVFSAAQEAPGPRSAAHGAGDARPGAGGRPDVDRSLDHSSRHDDGTGSGRGSEARVASHPRSETSAHNRPIRGAATVLDALIDARLLTAYEELAVDEDHEPGQRIEIIHESLLSNWPRLVRWRTQDADSAQLKDQLRQAAQMWIERGRPTDLLWTGTSYKEYELWRERYEGGLSESEEIFAGAMKSKAEQRKRRRLMALAVAIVGSLAIALATSSLWIRAENESQRAHAETRRAESQKLLALGQLELESSPTVALAYATKSLELADSRESRIFALRALAAGPPGKVLETDAGEEDVAHEVVFSQDGNWAALRGYNRIQVVSRDGSYHHLLEPFPGAPSRVVPQFSPSGQILYGAKLAKIRAWSIPEFQLIQEQNLTAGRAWYLRATPTKVFAISELGDEQIVSATSPEGQPREIGRFVGGRYLADIDRTGLWLAYPKGNSLLVRSLENWVESPRVVGTFGEPISGLRFHPREDRLLAWTDSGEVRIWSIPATATEPEVHLATAPGLWGVAIDVTRPRLATYRKESGVFRAEIWDLEAPVDAVATAFPPTTIASTSWQINGITFSPDSKWLATGNVNAACFFPVERPVPLVLQADPSGLFDLQFTPDSRRLVSSTRIGEIEVWSLETDGESQILARDFPGGTFLAVDPKGRFVAVNRSGAEGGGARILYLDGGEPRDLKGFGPDTWVLGIAIDPEGRLVAASAHRGPAEEKVIRIWDLDSDRSWTLGPTESAGEGFSGNIRGLRFLPDGRLLSAGDGGLRLWSIENGTHEILAPSDPESELAIFGNGRYAVNIQGLLALTDLETGSTKVLKSRGEGAFWLDVDVDGDVLASAGPSNSVQIGPATEAEPHLLMGHAAGLGAVAVSPDKRWVASGDIEGVIRVWPVPDLSRPPLHTLPHDELVARLRSMTNVYLAEDEESSTGWKVDTGPFPGWEEIPTG